MTKDTYAKPLITVIIPVYNGEQFISEAINNVLEQNYPALEIIVINDGSTDNTEFVVKNLDADLRYFYIENQGPSFARNQGVKYSTGNYIAFLDADDLLPENNLSILSKELVQNTEVDIVRGYAQLMKKNLLSGVYETEGDPRFSFPAFIGAALYRKEVFDKVGLFDTSLHFGEDSDWYMRATELNVRMKWLDQVTLCVRRHGENMTEGKDLVQLNTLRVFKKAVDRLRNQKNGFQENHS